MTDFDDEPVEATKAGEGADDWDDEPAKPRQRRKPADDDWDDDWEDDAPRGGRRDMTLVYAIIAAAVVIVLALVLTRGDSGSEGTAQSGENTETTIRDLTWQGPVGEAAGDVEARIKTEKGVFIWTDFTGWHVRSTLDEPVRVKVTADEIVTEDAGTQTELTETIDPGDGTEGLDLDLGFSGTATFEVTAGGAPIAANQVKLGGKGVAEQNPVTFTKA